MQFSRRLIDTAENKKERPGILLYWEDFSAIFKLGNADMILELLKAIHDYARYGLQPSLEHNLALEVLWEIIKPKLDRDAERYEEISAKRANAGRRGGLARAYNAKQSQANEANANFDKQIKPSATASTTASTTATVIKADEPPSPPRFVKPTVEEVESYRIEKGLNLDPHAFVDYYTSKGWKVGREPMKDWKAAARNWSRRESKQSAPVDITSSKSYELEGFDHL